MKHLFLSITIFAFACAGCTNKATKEHDHNDGTHSHDGSSSGHHSADSIQQQEFIITDDTVEQKLEPKQGHSHDGHEHDH